MRATHKMHWNTQNNEIACANTRTIITQRQESVYYFIGAMWYLYSLASHAHTRQPDEPTMMWIRDLICNFNLFHKVRWRT